jgi:hypothetical protein
MKKLLTTLTAIALSVAVVSTIDARQRSVQQPLARNMNEAAKQAMNATASKEDKDAALDEIIEMLRKNPDYLQLAQLFALRKQKENDISAKKDQIAAMNVGWFDFNNVDYKNAKNELAQLTTKLKNLNQEIANQSKVVGPEMSKAVKFAVGGAIAAAGLFAIDMYLGGAIRKAVMEKAGVAWEATAPVRKRAGEYYESGKAAIGRGAARAKATYQQYAPVRAGGTPETPTIPEPVEFQ